MSARHEVVAWTAAAWILGSATACRSATPGPAVLDPAHEACAYCRMIVSDRGLASQLIAPYEEPRFFDDMGCLRNYLATASTLPAQARVYVADHRTKAWVPAERAVYTRAEATTAAMGSHIITHESAASRNADPDATSGAPVDAAAVLGAMAPSGERP